MKRKTLLKVALAFLLISLTVGHPRSGAQSPPIIQRARGHAFPTYTNDRSLRPLFKVQVNLVVVRAKVVDRNNRCVDGLDGEYFHLFEDKVEQKIVHFAEEDAPISIGIIFDISGSMKAHFAAAKKSILRFIEHSNEQDDFSLISFNHRVSLDIDTSNRPADIQNSVALRTAGGRTALYDAVYMGLQKLHEARHAKRALIVITDGEDNSSRYSFNEVQALVKELDVQIYAIVQEGTMRYGRPVIERLVNLSGGRCFFASDFAHLESYIQQIHSELRRQYVLGYYPSNGDSNGRWRKIKIKLASLDGLTNLKVRAREGYYAQRR